MFESVIRKAVPADARAIAEVHVQSWRETYPGVVPADVIAALSVEEREKAWAENLLEGPPHFRFTFVVDLPGPGIVGFAAGGALRKAQGPGDSVDPALLERYSGELQAIYLLKAHQKSGLGRKLFMAVCAELKKRGHSNMLIWVLKDNPTREFYGRMGGREVAEKTIQIGAPLVELAYGFEAL